MPKNNLGQARAEVKSQRVLSLAVRIIAGSRRCGKRHLTSATLCGIMQPAKAVTEKSGQGKTDREAGSPTASPARMEPDKFAPEPAVETISYGK